MSKTQSPIGIASYPHLHKPDAKYGGFKVTLKVPSEDAQKFIGEIEAAQQAELAKQKAINPKYKEKLADLPFSEDEEGNIEFKFKVAEEGKYGSRRPAFYDAKGMPSAPVAVGGGSKIRLGVSLYSWMTPTMGCGVSLQPIGVQVIDFTPAGSGGFQFDPAEGGFEAAEEDQANNFAPVDESPAPSTPSEDEDF